MSPAGLKGVRRRVGEAIAGVPVVTGPSGPPAPEPPAVERLPLWPSPEQAAAAPFVHVRFPPGHFYSPLPDTRELGAEPRHAEVWPTLPRETPGIDWRDEAQAELCRELSRQERLDFPDKPTGDAADYHTGKENDQFSAFDAWLLEGMLRHLQPSRMVEVGSGYSTLVTARVNRELLDGSLHLTCVEPYARQFLVDGVDGVAQLRIEKVQETPLEVFEELGENDVLFIDTSHVAKTGSDVVWLYQEVVPRLRPGVVVHIHDMFAPGEYPEAWVLDGWAWNELYVVRAFLAFNSAFRVELGAQYLWKHHRELALQTFPGMREERYAGPGGGSLWIRRV